MTTRTLFLVLLFCLASIFAQTPNSITVKAVCRNFEPAGSPANWDGNIRPMGHVDFECCGNQQDPPSRVAGQVGVATIWNDGANLSPDYAGRHNGLGITDVIPCGGYSSLDEPTNICSASNNPRPCDDANFYHGVFFSDPDQICPGTTSNTHFPPCCCGNTHGFWTTQCGSIGIGTTTHGSGESFGNPLPGTGFYDWYHDTEFNQRYVVDLVLSRQNGSAYYSYCASQFFPLDQFPEIPKTFPNDNTWVATADYNVPGTLFAEYFAPKGLGYNYYVKQHVYLFTTHIQTFFNYIPGSAQFKYVGDDDVYVFINGVLFLDLGGTHFMQLGEIDLDNCFGKVMDQFNNVILEYDLPSSVCPLTPGQIYQMDVFHAERKRVHSNFCIETTITFFESNFTRTPTTAPPSSGTTPTTAPPTTTAPTRAPTAPPTTQAPPTRVPTPPPTRPPTRTPTSPPPSAGTTPTTAPPTTTAPTRTPTAPPTTQPPTRTPTAPPTTQPPTRTPTAPPTTQPPTRTPTAPPTTQPPTRTPTAPPTTQAPPPTNGPCCTCGNPTSGYQGASQTITFTQGSRIDNGVISATRSNPNKALGAGAGNLFLESVDTTEGEFTSLGFGGSLVVKFDQAIFNELHIYEVTVGSCPTSYPDERARVEVAESPSGPWTAVAVVHTIDGCVTGSTKYRHIILYVSECDTHCYKYVRITDLSIKSMFSNDGSADGFDVTAVTSRSNCICTAPPTLPPTRPPTVGAPTRPMPSKCCSTAVIVTDFVPGTTQAGQPVVPVNSDWAFGSGPSATPVEADATNFQPLGFGGIITLELSTPINGWFYIYEVTAGACPGTTGEVQVYVQVGNDPNGDFENVGIVSNMDPYSCDYLMFDALRPLFVDLSALPNPAGWKFVRIFDISDKNLFAGIPTADGFDLTAITGGICTEDTM